MSAYYFVGVAHGAMVAAVIAAIFVSTSLGDSPAQQNLPAEMFDSKSSYAMATEAGVIKIRIVSREVFDKEDYGRGSGAFTYPTKAPCEIVIPAGWQIDFTPYDEDARWDNPWYGSALAHEILHCMIPDWHAGYSARQAAGQVTESITFSGTHQ